MRASFDGLPDMAFTFLMRIANSILSARQFLFDAAHFNLTLIKRNPKMAILIYSMWVFAAAEPLMRFACETQKKEFLLDITNLIIGTHDKTGIGGFFCISKGNEISAFQVNIPRATFCDVLDVLSSSANNCILTNQKVEFSALENCLRSGTGLFRISNDGSIIPLLVKTNSGICGL